MVGKGDLVRENLADLRRHALVRGPISESPKESTTTDGVPCFLVLTDAVGGGSALGKPDGTWTLLLRGGLVAGCERVHEYPDKLVEWRTASSEMRLLRCGHCASNLLVRRRHTMHIETAHRLFGLDVDQT